MRLAGLALLAVLFCLSLFIGTAGLTPSDLLTDPAARELLLVSRLPRGLAAVLAGAALAITGQIMQVLARNRFVEPMTAGAGQSAALGILLITLLVPGAAIWAKMSAAAVSALAGSLGLMLLIRPLPPTQPLLVPLVALVYGGVIGAVVTYIAFQDDMMQFLGIWLTGELSGVIQGRYELLWLAGLAAGASWLIADRLTLLTLGEQAARGLGVNVRAVTAAGLVAISVSTAIVVVTLGAIPFVGLVVPNLVARFTGDNLRHALPATALTGALMVLGADILGRTLRAPFEIPASTMIALLGAAVFLVLLWQEGRRA